MPDTTPYQRYRDTRFFGSLNGLRFLCILAVMWHHSPVRLAWGDAPLALLRGFVGVDFFFVLSGFLITTLLLREEARDGQFSLRGFYWRRILRIVPVYFLVVTLAAIYAIVVKGRDELIPLLPYYYLFLSNMLIDDIPFLTITWSLAVEEQYYIFWPLLLVVVPAAAWLGRARFWLVSALIAACVALSSGLVWDGGGLQTEHAIWRIPAAGYGAIFLGAALALVLHTPRGFAAFYAVLGHRASPALSLLALGLFLQFVPGALKGWPSLGMHCLMAAALATIVLREDHVLARVMAWRPVARIGEISYGLYLYHLIGLAIAAQISERLGWSASGWPLTLLFIAVGVAMAELSFRSFEAAFLRLRYANKPKRAADTGG